MRISIWFRVVLIIAGWTLATVLGFYADDAARDWFRAPGFTGEPRTTVLRPLLENAVEAQLYLVVPGILLSFSNRRKLLTGFAVALLLSVIFTHSLKFTVGRSRPHLDLVPSSVAPLTSDARQQSFPSGHTSAAVAIAILLGTYFPRGKVVFWIVAAALGVERVRVEAHFLSDVIAGAGIGVLSVAVARRLIGPDCFTPQVESKTTSEAQRHGELTS